MKQNVIEKAAHECLATFEAFRRLGYLADHIFFSVVRNAGVNGNPYCAFVIVRVPGFKEVRIAALNLGSRREEAEAFNTAILEYVDKWNKTYTDAERAKIYGSSYVRANAAAFWMMLVEKGHGTMLMKRSPYRRTGVEEVARA